MPTRLLLLLTAGFLCVPQVARADARRPYDGYWASNLAACRNPDSPERMSIVAGLFQWYETRCRARSVATAGVGAWTVALSCTGEGQSFTTRSRVSLPSPGRLVIDRSPIGPSRRQVYIRCLAR